MTRRQAAAPLLSPASSTTAGSPAPASTRRTTLFVANEMRPPPSGKFGQQAFNDQGYERTTVRAVASAAGVDGGRVMPGTFRIKVSGHAQSGRRITTRVGDRRATSAKPARSYRERDPKNMKSSWLRSGLSTG